MLIKELLVESKKISPHEIKKIEGPVFIMMAGPIGAGKSWVQDQFLGKLKSIDTDLINQELSLGEFDSKLTGKSRAEAERRQAEFILRGQSFVRHQVGQNPGPILKGFEAAKKRGFTTVLFYVDVSLEQALKQNADRISSGGRGIPPEQEYKIERTVEKSKETVNQIKDDATVDYFIYFENKRDLNEGGMAFPGTTGIKKENIVPTLKNVAKFSGIPFEWLKNHMLGSAGLKPVSGDIDVIVPPDTNLDDLYNNLMKSLGEDNVQFQHVKKLAKAAIPIVGEEPNRVQVDFITGDAKWLKWAMGGVPSKVSGAHRGNLIQAIIQNTGNLKLDDNGDIVARVGYEYGRGRGMIKQFQQKKKGKKVPYTGNLTGVRDMEKWEHPDLNDQEYETIQDPKQAAELMFGKGTNPDDLKHFDKIWELVKKHPRAKFIIKEFYKIVKRNGLEMYPFIQKEFDHHWS